MNWAHVDLLLNHIPIVGSVFAFLLVAIGYLKNSEEWKKVSFLFFLIFALTAIPVYLTGEPAEKIIKNLPGVSISLIDEHEDAAMVSLLGSGSLGSLDWSAFISINTQTPFHAGWGLSSSFSPLSRPPQ